MRKNQYTIEDIKNYIEENRERMEAQIAESKIIPDDMKNDQKIKDIWFSGEWLGDALFPLGFGQLDIDAILDAIGYLDKFVDPYEISLKFVNEVIKMRSRGE
jgi:hypothetical protein